MAANIIIELMHAHCDVDKNKYIMLQAFVDHRKNVSAPSIEDQKIVMKR